MNSLEMMNKIFELEEIHHVNIRNPDIRKTLSNIKRQDEIAHDLNITMYDYYKYKNLSKLIPEIQQLVDVSITLMIAFYISKHADKNIQTLLYDKYKLLLSDTSDSKIIGKYIQEIKYEINGRPPKVKRHVHRDKKKIKKINYKSQNEVHIHLLSIWGNMKRRCYNENSTGYKNYGARGITMCDEWLNDFQSFENWAIQNGYDESCFDTISIDRIDNNGNYCPENCRWAERYEQANNRRNNCPITIGDVTMNTSQWCEYTGMIFTTLRLRIKAGWDAKKAVLTPSRKNPSHNIISEIKDTIMFQFMHLSDEEIKYYSIDDGGELNS